VTARTFCTERESAFPDILCWYFLLSTASACVTQFAASVTHSQIGITYFKQCAIVNTPKICRGSKFVYLGTCEGTHAARPPVVYESAVFLYDYGNSRISGLNDSQG
jgi:hypothetical protein